MAITNAQMEAILGVNGVNLVGPLNLMTAAQTNTTTAINNLIAANGNRLGKKIVEIPLYYGRDDEDPHEWLTLFEQGFVTNGWPAGADDIRKKAIAAGYLTEAVHDWNQNDGAAIQAWHAGANTDFNTRFLNYFSTEARRN